MPMLGSPCSPCCTPAVPCISNQGTFLIKIDIAASNYFQQRTDVFGARQFSGGPIISNFEATRKSSTFFNGERINGTFVISSASGICTKNGVFSSCGNSDGKTYFLSTSGIANCCWSNELRITIYNNPEPTNYALTFRTPVVRTYRETIVLPANTNNCQPPTYKDEQWFLAGECCDNSGAAILGCAETRGGASLNTTSGLCSGGVLTAGLPYIVTAPLAVFPPDNDLWFLKSSVVDAQYGSLDITVSGITIEPI